MLRYSLPATVKVFRKGIGGHRLEGDQAEDRSPGRVCDRLEYVASCFHFLVICYYVVANICAIMWLRKYFFSVARLMQETIPLEDIILPGALAKGDIFGTGDPAYDLFDTRAGVKEPDLEIYAAI